jgi:threonine/homoserine/homoserine lactone efflux protein
VLLIPLSTLAAFGLTSLLIELTPGPNMAYLAVLAVQSGRKAGYAATAGVALGLLLVGFAVAFGVATAITAVPALYETLRWAGVVYLLWLAYEGWRAAAETATDAKATEVDVLGCFRRGLITNLLNPKAAVFYLAMLPTFVEPARPVLGQTLVLTLLYVSIATLIHGGIVTLADHVRPYLEQADRQRGVRRGLSLLLAVIALWFAWTTRRVM